METCTFHNYYISPNSLSYIWLIQRRPLNRPWPIQTLALGVDSPSMHPRGRVDSIESDSENHPVAISTISSTESDLPPTYEDALVHSKPINWQYIDPEKDINQICYPGVCSCAFAQKRNQETQGTNNLPTRVCRICLKNSPNTRMTQLTFSIVKGFTNLDQSGTAQLQHQLISNNQNTRSQQQQHENLNQRKVSYAQLDVNQLLSSSPPRYSELMIAFLSGTNHHCNSNNK